MVLEATIFCLDNSDWNRNGDYEPSRWDGQVYAAQLLAENKLDSNPENCIGLMSMAGKRVEVLVTVSNDSGRFLNAIKEISLSGECDFITTLNIATLALKHRQNKNQRQRIIMFVGSPISHSAEELLAVARKLKRNSIAVNIISYGNHEGNEDKIKRFIEAINSSNNSSSVYVPPNTVIIDALFSSSLMGMEDQMVTDSVGGNAGSGQANNPVPQSQFDRDMEKAFELSREEERKRNEADKPKEVAENKTGPEHDKEMKETKQGDEEEELTEEQMLLKALEMSKTEHDKQVVEEKKKEDEEKHRLLESEDFMKDIINEISPNEGANAEELAKQVTEDFKNKNKKEGEDKEEKK